MAKLTEEMKQMLSEQLPFLATADENGMPKVGPKGSLHVLDDSHLAYFEHTFRHAFHNLTVNGRAAVAVADRPAQKGFQYVDLAKKNIPASLYERFPRAAYVIIDIESIFKLDNTLEAGTQIS